MSRVQRILQSIREDKEEVVLGKARTAGANCAICKGKKLLDCPYCPPTGECTVCQGTNKLKCTMCKPEKGLPG